MKKTTLLLSISAFALMAGCAGNQPKPNENVSNYQPEHSMGMNILKAGGVKSLYDFKDTEVDSNLYQQIQRENSSEHAMVRGVAVGAAAEAASMISGTGTFSGGVFWDNFDMKGIAGATLLASLTSPKHPMSRNHIVMWVPEDLAKTESEAKKVVSGIVFYALKNSTPNMIEYSYKGENRLQANIPVCLKADDDTRYRNCTMEAELKDTPIIDNVDDIEFKLVERPDFVNGYTKKAWVGYYDGAIQSFSMMCHPNRVEDSDKAACSTYNKLKEDGFIENLPEWMYVYSMNHNTKLGIVKQGSTDVVYPLIKPKNS